MTSILDSAPLPWDDGRVEKLRSVLVKAYNHPEDIKELVERVGPELAGDINWQNQRGVKAIWRQVMNNMARANVLRKLLNAALADQGVSGYHKEISTIMDDLGGGDQPGPGEKEIPVSAEDISMTELAAILAADLLRLADRLMEQIQRLASCSGRLDTALAAAAATTTVSSIKEALNSIEDIGPGKAAETPADDRDNALRKEIRGQLDVSARLLSKVAARHDDTTSATGLTVAAGRLRSSARRLAGLRERQHRSQ